MKLFFRSLALFAWMVILTGVVYPLVMTLSAQLFFSKQANGSIIEKDRQAVGSQLIAQKFSSDRYFWPRPSAHDYNTLESGGSNLAPTSKKLQLVVAERKKKLGEEAPAELLYASGSGLDPHLTLNAILFQIPRVAETRSINSEELRSFIMKHTEKRTMGLFGRTRVNVLLLNLALDETYGR